VISVSLRDLCRAACISLLALLLPWTAEGQESNANEKAAIHGTITDQTQAVVTGATVVLSNAAGFKRRRFATGRKPPTCRQTALAT